MIFIELYVLYCDIIFSKIIVLNNFSFLYFEISVHLFHQWNRMLHIVQLVYNLKRNIRKIAVIVDIRGLEYRLKHAICTQNVYS